MSHDPAAIPGARVVAKFDTGDPGLLEVPVGQGRLYFLASGWHPDDSQLAVSSKFVPLLWSMLEYRCTLGNSDGPWPVYQRHGLRPFYWFLNQSLVVHL